MEINISRVPKLFLNVIEMILDIITKILSIKIRNYL